jgi:hypothetical protein
MTGTAPAKTPTPNPYAWTPPVDDSSWKIVRNARVGITLLLLVLGVRAFRSDYGVVPLVSDIDLAVHEFGHMLFMPFGFPVLGQTMVILGGSLTQVALPLVFLGYFAFSKSHRDLHATTVCLWWASINLLSVAIYAADARARQLMLITGATGQEDDSGHDFYNLFSQWGVLNRDTAYAGRMRALAALLCFLSIVLGLYFAWLKRPERRVTSRE